MTIANPLIDFLFFYPTVIYALWIFYLAIMNLKGARDRGKLTGVAYYMGLPMLAIGYFLDALSNFTVMWLLFWEVPHEWLVTDRLSRHIHDPDSWRKKLAMWFGYNLLDPFDPSGQHLK